MDVMLRLIVCRLNNSYHRINRPYLITSLCAVDAHLTAGQFRTGNWRLRLESL